MMKRLQEWAATRGVSDISLDALVQLRQPLLAELSTKTKTLAKTLTTDFVQVCMHARTFGTGGLLTT